MTERENALIAINHGVPEWVPNFGDAYQMVNSSLINNNGSHPWENDIDMFGSKWIRTPDTGYASIPSPYEHILDDITKWEEVVKFPDIDDWDWEAAAAKDTANLDRKNKLVAMVIMDGNFNRLESLMGIENAMIAMYEEPEAVNDFFEAHTNFKLRLLEKAVNYYKPDIYIHGDDVASAFGLFMSPQVYRKLCNPYEKKLTQAGMEYGLIVEHHVCGKVDDIIPDIVATGASVWQIAQSMNDLVGIKQKYGDKICINGGWDISGECSRPNASEEAIRAEVRRCIDTYAPGGNYILFGMVMGDRTDPEIIKRSRWISDECKKYSLEFYKK